MSRPWKTKNKELSYTWGDYGNMTNKCTWQSQPPESESRVLEENQRDKVLYSVYNFFPLLVTILFYYWKVTTILVEYCLCFGTMLVKLYCMNILKRRFSCQTLLMFHVTVVYVFSLLYSISLYEYATIYSFYCY